MAAVCILATWIQTFLFFSMLMSCVFNAACIVSIFIDLFMVPLSNCCSYRSPKFIRRSQKQRTTKMTVEHFSMIYSTFCFFIVSLRLMLSIVYLTKWPLSYNSLYSGLQCFTHTLSTTWYARCGAHAVCVVRFFFFSLSFYFCFYLYSSFSARYVLNRWIIKVLQHHHRR